jgi:hypothetical protein
MLERGLTNPPQRIWSSRPKPRMTDHLQHTLIGASRQGPFSKECRHVLHGVSHGPNARCGSARGHHGWGRAKALPRGELCAPCESSVCMSVWLAGRPGQSDADRVSVFCTCATLMGPQRRCAGKLASRSQLRRSIFGMDN